MDPISRRQLLRYLLAGGTAVAGAGILQACQAEKASPIAANTAVPTSIPTQAQSNTCRIDRRSLDCRSAAAGDFRPGGRPGRGPNRCARCPGTGSRGRAGRDEQVRSTGRQGHYQTQYLHPVSHLRVRYHHQPVGGGRAGADVFRSRCKTGAGAGFPVRWFGSGSLQDQRHRRTGRGGRR